MLKLIGSNTSPYARKIRIILAEKQIKHEYVIDNPWDAGTQLFHLNPLVKIPCLVKEDGNAVYDSRVIAEYLDFAYPTPPVLLPQSDLDRVEVHCWEALADGICDAAILARLEKARPPAQQSPDWIERQMKKVTQGLAVLSSRLGNKTFCHGNAYTLADIATGVALGYLDFRFPELTWRQTYPQLVQLSKQLATRPAFAQTVPA